MNLDLLEQVLEGVVGGLLALSALLTLIRITIGPSVLDRVVATDVLVSIVVCALGAHAALTSGSTTLPLLISLSLVGFMGSVAVARFVARDRDLRFGQRLGGGAVLHTAVLDRELAAVARTVDRPSLDRGDRAALVGADLAERLERPR